MSEGMAFIGGVAVAGLAALVLVKGTGNPIQQPNFSVAPQMPATVMASPGMPSSGYYPYINPQLAAPSSDQRLELEAVKAQMERLKNDNEQLRTQNQQLQWQLLTQQQQNQLFTQQANQKAAALQPESGWWSSPVLWLVGGVTLTVGGGVVVAGILALFSPRQRNSRTVKLIHPYQGATSHLIPARRTQFLPSRSETRRMGTAEYDEMR